MKSLLIATTNPGKIKECQIILNNNGFQLLTLQEAIPKTDYLSSEKENGETFEANAVIKAKYYGDKTKILTLADDSGLSVDYLKGRPGVHSQRYGPDQAARNRRLLKELEGVPVDKRSAKFISVIAIYDPESIKVNTFIGQVDGHITTKSMGDRGFGYDPIFYSTKLQKTFGQATTDEKNIVSHRGRAFKKAIPFLNKLD